MIIGKRRLGKKVVAPLYRWRITNPKAILSTSFMRPLLWAKEEALFHEQSWNLFLLQARTWRLNFQAFWSDSWDYEFHEETLWPSSRQWTGAWRKCPIQKGWGYLFPFNQLAICWDKGKAMWSRSSSVLGLSLRAYDPRSLAVMGIHLVEPINLD